jgi:molybdopterin synthase catalytic subunit
MRPRILVQTEDFDINAEMQRLAAQNTGGIATFTGIVRTQNGTGPPITALTLEHYPGMTEAALAKIAEEAKNGWPLTACTIIHRTGRLIPGEKIVFVGTASAHRHAALASCAFLIDYLKTHAPFWKKEDFADDTSRWVDPT